MRRFYIKSWYCLLLLTWVVGPTVALAADTNIINAETLLQTIKDGAAKDIAAIKKREKAFLAEKALQEEKIRQAQKKIAELENASLILETRFNNNELLVEEKRQQRDKRLGSLKELFGHLTGAAGDARSRFRSSITTSQFMDREVFLNNLIKKMNSNTDLPTIEEIERLWFELHQEMTESGRVVKYSTKIGAEQSRELVRIGLFNLVSEGQYLGYDSGTASTYVLPRQPPGLGNNINVLQSLDSGYTAVGIDPTGAAGGGFLKAIINTPTVVERWHQGRHVGYIITVVQSKLTS